MNLHAPSIINNTSHFWTLDDAALLQDVDWKRAAPAELTEAARQGDALAFVREWRHHLRFGRPTAKIKAQLPAFSALWSLPALPKSDRATQLAEVCRTIQKRPRNGSKSRRRSASKRSDRGFPRLLRQWANQVRFDADPSLVELLMVLDLLSDTRSEIEPELYFSLWRILYCGSIDLRRQIETEPAGCIAEWDQLAVFHGELPFRLGIWFSDLKRSRSLQRSGADYLKIELEERTDTDGTSHVELLDRLPYWLAAFTRTIGEAARYGQKLWNAESRERLQSAIGKAALLLNSEGQLPFGKDAGDLVEILSTSADFLGLKKGDPPRSLLSEMSRNGKPSKMRRLPSRLFDEFPSVQSDWGDLAILRSDWSVHADIMSVAHHDSFPSVDLACLGQPILSGEWDLFIERDGEPLDLDPNWTCVCWHSDDDVDYVELQIALEDESRIERQLLLSRDEHFAMLCDSVLIDSQSELNYRSSLPPAAGAEFQIEQATREIRLKRGRLTTRVFPLALAERRVENAIGKLSIENGRLQYERRGRGGLYAPLIFDWHPDRRKAPAQWRTLTVTEQGRKLSSGEAAGHRLRVDELHLFLYRSLTRSPIARAVLGEHTIAETMVSEIDSDGEMHELVVVE